MVVGVAEAGEVVAAFGSFGGFRASRRGERCVAGAVEAALVVACFSCWPWRESMFI